MTVVPPRPGRRLPLPDPDALPAALARPPTDEVGVFWLGQAGFVVLHAGRVILIDPYLSDSLAAKYRGRAFDHVRLCPPPVHPEAFARVDLVLCSHRHGDHMDPGTLGPIAARHPSCRFVVPAAEIAHAVSLGLPPGRIDPANAGMSLVPLEGMVVTPVPAAHERRERDASGQERFLGFGLDLGGVRLYHSGDSVPFPELNDVVRGLGPDIALLPVNGRDATRAAAGVPGNFTLSEAIALCLAADIPTLVPHHWGLFAFNTIDPAVIDHAAAHAIPGTKPHILRPVLGRGWRFA